VGASRGIGRAIAIGFAQHGADIIGLARNAEALEEVAAQVRGSGRTAHIRHFDVFDPNAYPDLMRWLDEEQLDFDIVVHVPGGGTYAISESDERLARLFAEYDKKPPFWLMSDDDIDRVLTLGVKSAVSTCRYLAPRLMAKGRGSLIAIGSGIVKPDAPQRYADYAMEKGAVMCYMRAIAGELKPYGVAANVLLPGSIRNNRSAEGAPPEASVPAAVFLAQQDSSGVTGQWFEVRDYHPD
jgi:NAD(P)-dependent dehydrogenase (short-subunit alcohol dehydrogenase family)